MKLPYRFITLTSAETAHRRHLLDYYGLVAQISSFLILLFVFSISFTFHFIQKRIGDGKRRKERQSPRVSTFHQSGKVAAPSFGTLAWRRFRWALDEEVFLGWGTKQEWRVGGLWTAWLFVLAVRDTGDGTSDLLCCQIPSIEAHRMKVTIPTPSFPSPNTSFAALTLFNHKFSSPISPPPD